MLEIQIDQTELYDNDTETFIYVKPCTLRLEHSLVSISKWESKWKKPFLDKKPKTVDESLSYIECMTLNQNVDPIVYRCITPKQMSEINAYIDDDKTATKFAFTKKPSSGEFVTSELVYYWMASYQIPFEAQKWHFSRLMALIRIFGEKNKDPKKIPKSEIYARNRALNASRRAKLKSKG